MGSSDLAGEAVELAAGVVSPIDHGVVVAVEVGGPPALEHADVKADLVVGDVEPAGGLELLERAVDVASA